jgi:hypothetical protein
MVTLPMNWHGTERPAAAAINIKRILIWLADVPRSTTRLSYFAALAPA